MRILFIVPYPPNLIRVRPYNLVRHLRQLGHDVTIATVWTTESEQADVDALRDDGFDVIAVHLPRTRSLWNIGPAMWRRLPLQALYSWHPALAERLRDELNRPNGKLPYDIVHVEHLRGAQYGLYVQAHTATPVVWDSVDCISLLFEQAQAHSASRFGRMMTRFELPRTRRYESQLLTQFDPVLVTSPVDRQALLNMMPAGSQPPTICAFHGVDTDYFCPDASLTRDAATILVTGKMSYHANITMVLHLANDIMPLVWRQRPDAQLLIVGSAPSAEIMALATHPAITVTGKVDDMRPYLRRATVAAAPIAYGTGVQNKVLEAMACATPVVTTPQGCAALELVPDRDLLVADTSDTFAAALIRLLETPALCDKIGTAGYETVTQTYNWRSNTLRLQEVYHELIQQSG